MWMRRCCQFKTLFAVLALAAVIAQIHGEGKNLASRFHFFVFVKVSAELQKAMGKTRSVLGQEHRADDVQIYKCEC